jgi:hypothetical protein
VLRVREIQRHIPVTSEGEMRGYDENTDTAVYVEMEAEEVRCER